METRGKRTTIKDIARRLDVSHATVSRALNRPSDPMISEATRRRVRELASEMGYRPNLAARSLAGGRTGLVALWLWVEELQESYQADIARLMHAELRRRAHHVVANFVDRDTIGSDPNETFDTLQVDGIVAHEAGPALEAVKAGGRRLPAPIVSTGAYNFVSGADRVTIDVVEAISDAMKHLLALGRRRIVHVTGDLEHLARDPRFLTYTSLVEAAGLPKAYVSVKGGRPGARAMVREYIEANGVPDALFCHNDDIALAAYRGLCDAGVRVPDDTAIVGCDGIEEIEYLEVPITTIAQPFPEMCRIATAFLDRRIEDPTCPHQEAVLSARLVIRASTGGAPG